jgi:catechol 2,3-dioxygenase-like lactoylglutathione lyase family enzyme
MTMKAAPNTPTHGRIMGGVVATPDLAASLEDYHGRLGLPIVERGTIGAALASSWGVPELEGAPMATLQPASGAPCFIRLVEQPLPPDFRPTTTFGWGSYEITVQEVFNWPAKLEGSGFSIVGEPKEIPSMPYFVAMQMLGRGGEMIYLNETRMNTPSNDLPVAVSPVDHMFIVILATPDREATVEWYRNKLRFEAGDTYTIEYTMINAAFDLPAGTTSSLTMVQKGRLPIVEVDDYPSQAKSRVAPTGGLPPGNALVSLAIDNLDAVDLPFIQMPQVLDGPVYGGRRSATVVGPAGEYLELIEIG